MLLFQEKLRACWDGDQEGLRLELPTEGKPRGRDREEQEALWVVCLGWALSPLCTHGECQPITWNRNSSAPLSERSRQRLLTSL